MISSKSQVVFVLAGEEVVEEKQPKSDTQLQETSNNTKDKRPRVGAGMGISANKKPYITYYQVSVGSESSSAEPSREVTPINKKGSDKTNSKFDSFTTVVEIDELYEDNSGQNGTKNVDKNNSSDDVQIAFAIDGTSYDIVK